MEKNTNNKNKKSSSNKTIKVVKNDERKKFNEKIKKEEKKKNIIVEEPKEEIKEVKKEEKKDKKRIDLITKFSKLDDNRKAIYSFIIGLLLGLLILVIVYPDRIAKLKDGTEPVATFGKTTITADDLYEEMKDYFTVSKLIDIVDDKLLTKLYPENDEMNNSINENYNNYINYYSQAGYTEEQFLEGNGFKSKDDFLDVLRLDYRRSKYLDDYVEENITKDEINKYYDDEVFGDINSKHMLVATNTNGSDGLSDEEAKALAEEIIDKLNNGATFDEVKDEYKDRITYEELGYQAFNASLEEAYMNAIKKLKNDEYTKTPVQTSYGYHVIYRIDQKDKPELKDIKDEVIDAIAQDKKSADSNLLYKALISLRESKKLDFSDSVLKKKYEAYCKNYK